MANKIEYGSNSDVRRAEISLARSRDLTYVMGGRNAAPNLELGQASLGDVINAMPREYRGLVMTMMMVGVLSGVQFPTSLAEDTANTGHGMAINLPDPFLSWGDLDQTKDNLSARVSLPHKKEPVMAVAAKQEVAAAPTNTCIPTATRTATVSDPVKTRYYQTIEAEQTRTGVTRTPAVQPTAKETPTNCPACPTEAPTATQTLEPTEDVVPTGTPEAYRLFLSIIQEQVGLKITVVQDGSLSLHYSGGEITLKDGRVVSSSCYYDNKMGFWLINLLKDNEGLFRGQPIALYVVGESPRRGNVLYHGAGSSLRALYDQAQPYLGDGKSSLAEGLNMAVKKGANNSIIILPHDGNMVDPSNQDGTYSGADKVERTRQEALLNEALQLARDKGIKIYTIGLMWRCQYTFPQSDYSPQEDNLERIARETGGCYLPLASHQNFEDALTRFINGAMDGSSECIDPAFNFWTLTPTRTLTPTITRTPWPTWTRRPSVTPRPSETPRAQQVGSRGYDIKPDRESREYRRAKQSRLA
ncbi:MAG: hypothetical protein WC686_01030 [Candidatus Shapirobacteria bacterium]|jgi:hypothetical protein